MYWILPGKRKCTKFTGQTVLLYLAYFPKQHCPQQTIIEPSTVYGISKYAGEFWCNYFHNRYGVDVRSLRYPGLISYKSEPGGGTTDYAIEIFNGALEEKKYRCFLKEDTFLPMMYMPDAIRATLELMDAPADKISVRTSYNISGMSFSPKEIGVEILKHIPDFKLSYAPTIARLSPIAGRKVLMIPWLPGIGAGNLSMI